MAAKKFDEVWVKINNKVKWPVYSQPKLDGMRAIAVWDGANVRFFTRKHKPILGLEHHVEHIKRIMAGCEPRYFDGELYEHGTSLQKIGSIMRNESKTYKKMTYWIFDTFQVDKLNKPFSERLMYLNDISERMRHSVDDYPIIDFVETIVVRNKADMDNQYKVYRDDGYEGQMIKLDLPYESNWTREKRSGHVLKRKERQSAEFKIIGYDYARKGAHEGAILFKLEANGKEFTAQPVGMSIAEMKNMYTVVKYDEGGYIGKMATIEFEEYSDEGVPKQPKFVTVRDYE
jgi:DNA ligase-1